MRRIIATSRKRSVPGRIATCSSAIFAVSVRRGSTTTTFPPPCWMALRSEAIRGRRWSRVIPLVTSGLVPSRRAKRARAASGCRVRFSFPSTRSATAPRSVYSRERTLNELGEPKAWQNVLARVMVVLSAALPQ